MLDLIKLINIIYYYIFYKFSQPSEKIYLGFVKKKNLEISSLTGTMNGERVITISKQ